MQEVRQWQTRPLEAVDPIVDLDCLVVKVKENQRVSNKAVYLALGVTLSGNKERLGNVALAAGRRQVLAGGAHRTAKPRGEGYLHCLCGWADRLSRGH